MPRFAALLLLCASAPAFATTVQYHDDDELFAMADAVIVGHVWRELVSFEAGMTRSRYEIQVQESLKGPKAGEYIVVQTPGGESPEFGGGEFIAGSPHPKPGADVIVFLAKHGNEYGVLSLALGHYELRYDAGIHRYLTHRDTASLALVKPGSQAVLVPEDQLATEVLAHLRKLSAERAR